MNDLCVPRKRRNDPIIKKMAPLFSKAMHEGNINLAANIAFVTVLELDGTDGIMSALEQGNKFWMRKNLRRSL
jgi:hypothetical protein